MSKKHIFLSVLFLYVFSGIFAQNNFSFLDKTQKKQSVSFQLINNLIVIPVTVNGKELSFILDSGVNKTIIFNLTKNDSIGLLNTEKIVLRGLGNGEPVAALLTTKNTLKIKNIKSSNEAVYVIVKDFFDLSSRMGITINGIIGYNLIRDFIVKINYKTKRITFYNSKKYKLKKCKKCEILPIQLFRKKPYLNVSVQLDTIGSKFTKVKMLIDSGASDALWLFEDSKTNIKTPKLFFNDILGEGLTGAIYGNRSRIPKLKVGSFTIDKPTISFLDTVASKNARIFKARNGSIGGNILKRFKVWLDYRNKKIMLRKNGSFNKGFQYNMSGLDVIYNGKQLVKEKKYNVAKDGYNNKVGSGNKAVNFVTSYSYKFKPSFKIKAILKNSPADKAGLLPEDIILKINNKKSYEHKLSDIIAIFQEKDNKKVNLVIERNGIVKKFNFRLKQRI